MDNETNVSFLKETNSICWFLLNFYLILTRFKYNSIFILLQNFFRTLQSKAMGGCDIDDGLWTGTIYAKEITSVRINTYLISGSLSSPASGSARPILQEVGAHLSADVQSD